MSGAKRCRGIALVSLWTVLVVLLARLSSSPPVSSGAAEPLSDRPGPAGAPAGGVRPWLRVTRATIAGQARPYDFHTLGPILTLRHHLAEVQWASLNKPPESPDPVLARIEIVDAVSLALREGTGGPGLTQRSGERGFSIRALLYWVSVQPVRGSARSASRLLSPLPLAPGAVDGAPELRAVKQALGAQLDDMIRGYPDPADRPDYMSVEHVELGLEYDSNGRVWRPTDALSQWGPQPIELRIDSVDYLVTPVGVGEPREVPGQYGRLKEVVQGVGGWAVDVGATQVVDSETALLGDYNHLVPLYDISVQGFPAKPPAPPEGGLPVTSNTHCQW